MDRVGHEGKQVSDPVRRDFRGVDGDVQSARAGFGPHRIAADSDRYSRKGRGYVDRERIAGGLMFRLFGSIKRAADEFF